MDRLAELNPTGMTWQYNDCRYGTETVSHEVLAHMKQLMVENNSAASHSFLLDDDSSIPFSLDDIQNLMDDKASSLRELDQKLPSQILRLD